jgi:hypothetical protein
MSCTELFLVPRQGEIQLVAEFRNSHGGAAYVWDKLSEMYLHWQEFEWCKADDQKIKQLWALNHDPRLTLTERITLTTTYDGVMVRRRDLLVVADAFEAFAARHGPGTHLPAQAVELRKMAGDLECYAACWNQTSVNADTWWVRTRGEYQRRYNLYLDRGQRRQHWFLDLKALHGARGYGPARGRGR